MQICLVGSELFRAYRRTDRHDEANSRFSQLCVHPKESLLKM